MEKSIVRRELNLSELELAGSIHPILKRVYAARGICKQDEIQRDLKGLISAAELKGIDGAVELLVTALQQQKRILIVGDFDVDGATSSALGVLALRKMGAQHVDYLVPNRFEYGYGLTPEIVDAAETHSNDGPPDLLITVDNGIASIEGVNRAKEKGWQVLVTDHHLAGDLLPNADVIVNPNQIDCPFPSKSLAGVGVIFYVMTALRTKLRSLNWFEKNAIDVPNMAQFLDLVALGTVADVVPLDSNNRILVHHGLRRIRAGLCRPGVKALVEVSNRKLNRLVASDLGFSLGPRLNAAGRLDDMSRGIECLLTDSDWQAKELALELDSLNGDRKKIEEGMRQNAMESLQNISLDELALPFGVCLFDDSWHQGVIGIVASRIKDRYNRPVVAFALADESANEDGAEIKGSARSVPGFHLKDALDAICKRHPHLMKKFGGHAMAAGLTLDKSQYEVFAKAFDEEVRSHLNATDLIGEIKSDGELEATDFSLILAQELRDAGPWGQAFPEPLFDGEFRLIQQRIVGEKHLKMVLGVGNEDRIIDAIAFNVDLEHWPSSAHSARIAYRLDINEFRDKQSVQLMVEHLEPMNL
ncbi:MAG: single-stranded-DNA-specific exonuclease RecJ [Pseudomonadales bacterium]|nr:single-stranded-DNA-specific exonuclease RecJ [Pseudomonadales bacterium]